MKNSLTDFSRPATEKIYFFSPTQLRVFFYAVHEMKRIRRSVPVVIILIMQDAIMFHSIQYEFSEWIRWKRPLKRFVWTNSKRRICNTEISLSHAWTVSVTEPISHTAHCALVPKSTSASNFTTFDIDFYITWSEERSGHQICLNVEKMRSTGAFATTNRGQKLSQWGHTTHLLFTVRTQHTLQWMQFVEFN